MFYEVFLLGFADGNGTGDLPGLTSKLDYLQWLGIDCIWRLPFYSSPLRDGGYDISDFFTIHPTYGQLGDAVDLMEEAHRRGIRLTADAHPWFQSSSKLNDNLLAVEVICDACHPRHSMRHRFHHTQPSSVTCVILEPRWRMDPTWKLSKQIAPGH